MIYVWHAWYTGGVSYTHFSFKRFKLIILWSSIAQNVFNSPCFFFPILFRRLVLLPLPMCAIANCNWKNFEATKRRRGMKKENSIHLKWPASTEVSVPCDGSL